MAMAKGEVTVDYEICLGCGVCIQACPFSYLALTHYTGDPYKRVYPELEEGHGCNGCGICSGSCPLECMTATKKDEKNEASLP